jgi:hypothetical protein
MAFPQLLLALWALGDVFGKTKEIDITFTK